MHLAVPRLLVRRSIMLLVSVALLAMTLIGLAGMGASFLVVERSQGSAQAIEAASNLRGHTRRIANLIAVEALNGRAGISEAARGVIADIERELEAAALHRFVDEAPGELFAATYRGVHAGWDRAVKPRIETLAGHGPPHAREVEELLAEIEAFVGQVDTLLVPDHSYPCCCRRYTAHHGRRRSSQRRGRHALLYRVLGNRQTCARFEFLHFVFRDRDVQECGNHQRGGEKSTR